MPKKEHALWYCFLVTLLTLLPKNPDIKMSDIISKLKTWFPRNSYEMKAIYFVEDYEYGVPITPQGRYGMDGVLRVLKMFYDSEKLLDPQDKDHHITLLS
jgi:hypothetical protein